MLKWVQNIYNNKDNKSLSVMSMEFFVSPFATRNSHNRH